jgi:ABC-type oligopeptide transport system ATPase subunit
VNEPFVQLQNVTKVYDTRGGSVRALDGVSFDVPEFEFLSILGPSGCGKSTLRQGKSRSFWNM